jgi:hypothetical protein
VSLFSTVIYGHATGAQDKTFDQADTPAPVPTQVIINWSPAREVYPASQLTVCVAKVDPVIDVESLLETVKVGQATASQVNTPDQADNPAERAEQVTTNVIP